MTHPEWLREGANVRVLSRSWNGPPSKPIAATIKKIGKRDVVLDNGSRFNVNRLEKSVSEWGGHTSILVSADDPAVAKARADYAAYRIKNNALAACEGYLHKRASHSAAEVILALAPLTGVEAEIRALFERPGGAA